MVQGKCCRTEDAGDAQNKQTVQVGKNKSPEKKILQKRIDKGNSTWYKDLKRVKRSYKAPDTKSISLVIPDSIAEKLKTLWTAAVSTPAENDLNILGGTTWTFFANGKKAKGKGRINDRGRVTRLSELAYNLIKTVKKQDANLILQQEQEIDELIAEFSK